MCYAPTDFRLNAYIAPFSWIPIVCEDICYEHLFHSFRQMKQQQHQQPHRDIYVRPMDSQSKNPSQEVYAWIIWSHFLSSFTAQYRGGGADVA